MTITAEELRKVYDEGWNDTYAHRLNNWAEAEDAAIHAVAKFVAEKQRAVEPTEKMVARGGDAIRFVKGVDEIYRAMSSVAPLVVPE